MEKLKSAGEFVLAWSLLSLALGFMFSAIAIPVFLVLWLLWLFLQVAGYVILGLLLVGSVLALLLLAYARGTEG